MSVGIDFVVFLGDWFGFHTLEDHSSVILVALTVSHVLSILMTIFQPVFTVCYDNEYIVLSLIEIIGIFSWSMTLLYVYACSHLFGISSRSVMKRIQYLHFAGIVWLPALIIQWGACIKTIHFPSIFNSDTDPSIEINYAPMLLNGCLNSSKNYYRTYIIDNVDIIFFSTLIGLTYSAVNLVMRYMEEYIFGTYNDTIVAGLPTSPTDSTGRGIQSSKRAFYLPVGDSLDQYSPVELTPGSSSTMGMEMASDRLDSRATQSQQHEVEVHPEPMMESHI